MKKATTLALCLLAALPLSLSAKNICTGRGYVLAFFNGVNNTKFEAEVSELQLLDRTGDSYKNEPIEGELMYNQTQGLALDLAETFMQKAQESDGSGYMARHFELYWEALLGQVNKEGSWWERIRGLLSSDTVFNNFGISLTNELDRAIIGDLSTLLANPPTEADYAEHNTRLDALTQEQKKIMMVAHSQGNLFANHAYDYITPKVGTDAVKLVHIAPASAKLHGDYELADIDLVIKGLGLLGYTVPPANTEIPYSIADIQGHSLVDTYLDRSRPGNAKTVAMMMTALDKLQPPPTVGQTGSFTVTMTWNGPGDVDLHTIEATGDHVSYRNRQGSVGYLDVDNTYAYGPEHYFATCDSDGIVAGDYQIAVNNFAAPAGTVATIQAAGSREGVLLTRQIVLGNALGSAGDNSPEPVLDVIVSKDENGEVTLGTK